MYVEYRIVDNLGLIYDLCFNSVCYYVYMYVCMYVSSCQQEREITVGWAGY